jgi:hypothetical protein
MHHDSVAAPSSRDTMPMHDMPGMPGMRDTSATARVHAAGTPSANKLTTTKTKTTTAKKKTTKKKTTKKTPPKPAAPAGHDMPRMQHHMPGMKMPADTAHRP